MPKCRENRSLRKRRRRRHERKWRRGEPTRGWVVIMDAPGPEDMQLIFEKIDNFIKEK